MFNIFFYVYLPGSEHKWLVGSGGIYRYIWNMHVYACISVEIWIYKYNSDMYVYSIYVYTHTHTHMTHT